MKILPIAGEEFSNPKDHGCILNFVGSVRIQKLNGVRRLLKKLSFIFDLPARLNRAIELDACTEAVGPWCG
jgi:hypothetical protein